MRLDDLVSSSMFVGLLIFLISNNPVALSLISNNTVATFV